MRNIYNSPLINGNCTKEMSYLFSDDMKYITWRKLWTVLAESEMELGYSITPEQISQLKENINNINYEALEENEKEIKSEIINNIYAFGLQCPESKNIIHVKGDTSYIKDNADLIIIKEAISILRVKLIKIINNLLNTAIKYKDLPILGYFDYSGQGIMTVGKKIGFWIKDLLIDYKNLEYILSNIEFKGIKGLWGNQLDLMELFDNDKEKVNTLDRMVTAKMGFDRSFKLCGKFYSKKMISIVLDFLSQIGETACKFANEYRFLESLREFIDTLNTSYPGSSKKHSIADRMSSLSKAVISNSLNGAMTSINQHYDGGSDEYINQKISIAESFMEIDEVLNLYMNISADIAINEELILKHVDDAIPFIAMDKIVQAAVKNGGDKAVISEKMKEIMSDIIKRRNSGRPDNILMQSIINDDDFKISEEQFKEIVNPYNFIGRSIDQLDEFIEEEVMPIIEVNKHIILN